MPSSSQDSDFQTPSVLDVKILLQAHPHQVELHTVFGENIAATRWDKAGSFGLR